MIHYLKNLSKGKTVLWCYFIWYLIVVRFYFDPTLAIWLNSLGISLVIGLALNLSVSSNSKKDKWQVFRLFLMPFCVSSFSSLIKGQNFIFIIPPKPKEQITLIISILIFLSIVFLTKNLKFKKTN